MKIQHIMFLRANFLKAKNIFFLKAKKQSNNTFYERNFLLFIKIMDEPIEEIRMESIEKVNVESIEEVGMDGKLNINIFFLETRAFKNLNSST